MAINVITIFICISDDLNSPPTRLMLQQWLKVHVHVACWSLKASLKKITITIQCTDSNFRHALISQIFFFTPTQSLILSKFFYFFLYIRPKPYSPSLKPWNDTNYYYNYTQSQHHLPNPVATVGELIHFLKVVGKELNSNSGILMVNMLYSSYSFTIIMYL